MEIIEKSPVNFNKINVDKGWIIEKFKIKNKKLGLVFDTKECRYEHLRGVIQIGEFEFLTYGYGGLFDNSLDHIKINPMSGKLERKLSICFEKCYKLSDDLLLCEMGAKRYNVWSISKDQIIEEFNWLREGYEIKPYQVDNEIVLLVSKKFNHKFNEEIYFTVDIEKFDLKSPVYSTLRNSNISVNGKDEIKSICDKEKEYCDIAYTSTLEIEEKQKQKSIRNLLTAKKEI